MCMALRNCHYLILVMCTALPEHLCAYVQISVSVCTRLTTASERHDLRQPDGWVICPMHIQLVGMPRMRHTKTSPYNANGIRSS